MGTRETDPASVLFGTTRRAILGLFFTRPDENFHLRQIVRLTGAGVGAVQRELDALGSSRILTRESRGTHVFYAVNRKSPIFRELQGIVIKTTGLVNVLRAALAPAADRVHLAFVHGSFARGEHHRDSDIDVVIISEQLQIAQLAKLLRSAEEQLGREVNPMLYRSAEFVAKVRSRNPFVQRVLQRDKIMLIGSSDELERLVDQRLAPQARNAAGRNHRAASRGRSRPARLQGARTQR